MTNVRRLIDAVVSGQRPASVLTDALADDGAKMPFGHVNTHLKRMGFKNIGITDTPGESDTNDDDTFGHHYGTTDGDDVHHVKVTRNMLGKVTGWEHHTNHQLSGSGTNGGELMKHLGSKAGSYLSGS